MQSSDDTIPAPQPASAGAQERARTGARAAEALLREHPNAVVYAQRADAALVPVPEELGLEGRPVLATEGRSGMDFFVAEDRMAMVNAWIRVRSEAVAEVRARLCTDPRQWMNVLMLDMRHNRGIVLNMMWPCDEAPEDEESRVAPSASLSTTPRFCTRKQDEEGNVLDCDEAYLQMFGYSREEVVGHPTFERVHPEDQARVIEGWIAAVATGRTQMFRIRMKRKDGSWLWVDTTLHSYLSDPEQRCVLAECIDVSAEMSAQEALQDREELLRNLLEEMPDGLLQLDRERRVVYRNARLLEILPGPMDARAIDREHVEEGEPQRANTPAVTLDELLQALTDESRQSLDVVIEHALAQGVRQEVEVEATLPSAQQRHILMKVRPLQRESGVVTGVIASVLDVTDSARARRELERRATFDALTGAHNRSSIMEALEQELQASTATGVVFVDLDQFKSVNDTLGHAAGDEVLVHVAERLKAAMRSSDELGRLGGDEFLVLLRGISGLGMAMRTAQRISESVRGTCMLTCGSLELCASVGVACVEDDGATSAEALVERADAAMYCSKEQRRGIPVLAA
ncbi:MAG TPA: diguanylate cyclase [Solirubrobacteraceae bacterium]|nr:diguanylate cyclase [Solirubrobacteraceae bacterium]